VNCDAVAKPPEHLLTTGIRAERIEGAEPPASVTHRARVSFIYYDLRYESSGISGLPNAPGAPIYRETEATMVKAVWNGVVIAESDDTVVVEGNHYFPRAAVDAGVLRDSDTTTTCPWKGIAHYHTLSVGGAENRDAAWYYPEPKPAAAEIRGRVAFWKGVEVG